MGSIWHGVALFLASLGVLVGLRADDNRDRHLGLNAGSPVLAS